jgi:hypothetical protein
MSGGEEYKRAFWILSLLGSVRRSGVGVRGRLNRRLKIDKTLLVS